MSSRATAFDPIAAPDAGGAGLALAPALGGLAALAGYLFLIAFPHRGQAPIPTAAPLAALAFTGLQLAFPAARPSPQQVVCPLNWLILVFFLQLVVMPFTICAFGPSPGLLPHLPGEDAIDRAIVLSIVAFAAFTVGYAAPSGGAPPRHRAPVRVAAWLVPVYASIGVVGLLLAFGSFGDLFAALADPSRFSDQTTQQASLRSAASTFLRPFLLNGIVLAWCAWLDRGGARAILPIRWSVAAATACSVVVVGATYAFNRASFMVPLAALAATYSVHARRLSLRTLLVLGAVMGLLAWIPGQYRSSRLTFEDLVRSSAARQEVVMGRDDLNGQFQLYGAAPQFPGYLLEAAEHSHERFTPRVLLSSLLSPVPILGKAFRDSSGPAVYNRLVYGNTGIEDQIIPFEGEVYLCLGPGGLVAAFLALGLVVHRLQRAFEHAGTAFASYVVQFTAIWASFLVLGSLSAVTQIFVYFFWPIYGWALLTRIRRSLREATA